MQSYLSRKFVQSLFVQITGAFALFQNKIDGGTYVALSTLALAIHSIGSTVDKKLNPDTQG
jgi:hypothetical protein